MKLREKNLRDRKHDSYILKQYETQYSITSYNRYKHSNKFLLADGTTINGNLNPWDLTIIPHSGLTNYVVQAGEENRLDLVATKVYGSATLYWVLAYVNNIEDPLDLPVGTVLLVPKLQDMFQYPNPLA